MTDQQNLILAIVLSVLVIVAFQYFYDIPRRTQLEQQRAAQEAAREAVQQAAPAGVPAVPGSPAADVPAPPGAAPQPAAEALGSRRAALVGDLETALDGLARLGERGAGGRARGSAP